MLGVDGVLAQPVKFGRYTLRPPALGLVATGLGFDRAKLQPEAGGNQLAAGREEPPPRILERMQEAVIEAEVADVVADDQID